MAVRNRLVIKKNMKLFSFSLAIQTSKLLYYMATENNVYKRCFIKPGILNCKFVMMWILLTGRRYKKH